MRITFCQGVSVPCAVSTSIFMVLPRAAAFLEFKSQQLVRRSSQLHGSSQIISSTPLLLTTACAWNVSVPLENTAGAHPRGWVGPSCLRHNPHNSVWMSCLDQPRPVEAERIKWWNTALGWFITVLIQLEQTGKLQTSTGFSGMLPASNYNV